MSVQSNQDLTPHTSKERLRYIFLCLGKFSMNRFLQNMAEN